VNGGSGFKEKRRRIEKVLSLRLAPSCIYVPTSLRHQESLSASGGKALPISKKAKKKPFFGEGTLLKTEGGGG